MTEARNPTHLARHDREGSTIGVVEAVSPNEIKVGIFSEAPHGTGLFDGELHRFPHVNGHIVVPSEQGSILARVVWVGIDLDRSQVNPRDDQIGLPHPRRRLHAVALGVLKQTIDHANGSKTQCTLDRGALTFPTIGDPVRLPTRRERRAAVPGSSLESWNVDIGIAPDLGNLAVQVDPDRLFGGHLAVLGNTGSGKSCTVAQLLRSSANTFEKHLSGFRVIIIDSNGEYVQCLDDLSPNVMVRKFSASPEADGQEQLRVPYWLWNDREWLSFANASSRSQAPQLQRALQMARQIGFREIHPAVISLIFGMKIVEQFSSRALDNKTIKDKLLILMDAQHACKTLMSIYDLESEEKPLLDRLWKCLKNVLDSRLADDNGTFLFKPHVLPLDDKECDILRPLFSGTIEHVAEWFLTDPRTNPHAPIPFNEDNLMAVLPLVAGYSDSRIIDWLQPMLERLRTKMSDQRLLAVAGQNAQSECLSEWLSSYMAGPEGNQIAVVDLSLVSNGTRQLIVGVLSRVLLESLERHRILYSQRKVPMLLVVDEAHLLMQQASQVTKDDVAVSPSQLCRETFERIAREGRKFGLSLVVSSQRPSELSQAVLSQCNTFLVHRVVNPNDQNLVMQMLPDRMKSLAADLSNLPAQTVLGTGWAFDLPGIVRIAYLPRKWRPNSASPSFRSSWSGEESVEADWGTVASKWTSSSVKTHALMDRLHQLRMVNEAPARRKCIASAIEAGASWAEVAGNIRLCPQETREYYTRHVRKRIEQALAGSDLTEDQALQLVQDVVTPSALTRIPTSALARVPEGGGVRILLGADVLALAVVCQGPSHELVMRWLETGDPDVLSCAPILDKVEAMVSSDCLKDRIDVTLVEEYLATVRCVVGIDDSVGTGFDSTSVTADDCDLLALSDDLAVKPVVTYDLGVAEAAEISGLVMRPAEVLEMIDRDVADLLDELE